MPYLSQSAHQGLTSMNNDSTLVTLNGKLGHLEGVTNVSAQAQAIRQFLENDKAAMQWWNLPPFYATRFVCLY